MNGKDLIKPPSIDLITLLRIAYPGVLLTAFIYLRYSESLANNLPFIFGALALISGIGFHALYRGTLYSAIVRRIERKIGGYPQYEFHLSVAKELDAPQRAKTIEVASACQYYVLMTRASPEFRTQNVLFNSLVHVLFMTAFVCLFFFLHDIALLGFKLPWVWLWPLAFVVIFGAGIVFDKEADLRETLLLKQDREEYEKVLRTYFE